MRISERVVNQAADAGNCVAVGRGVTAFSAESQRHAAFLSLRSQRSKVQRLISERTREADAKILMDTVDRERAAFIKSYFRTEWPNGCIYHAMINTAVGDENCNSGDLEVP